MSTAGAAQETEPEQRTAVYVYGIVPADVEPEPHAAGIGDPPSDVAVVRHGEIAALISEITLDRPLGTPDDLTATRDCWTGRPLSPRCCPCGSEAW
jgi:hypothetical protein